MIDAPCLILRGGGTVVQYSTLPRLRSSPKPQAGLGVGAGDGQHPLLVVLGRVGDKHLRRAGVASGGGTSSWRHNCLSVSPAGQAGAGLLLPVGATPLASLPWLHTHPATAQHHEHQPARLSECHVWWVLPPTSLLRAAASTLPSSFTAAFRASPAAVRSKPYWGGAKCTDRALMYGEGVKRQIVL